MDEYERFMSRARAKRRAWRDAAKTDRPACCRRHLDQYDAGCGLGTWLRRLVTRAHVLGFTTITARSFDVARVQVQRARLLARDLCGISGVNLTFDVADLTGELPEADTSVDLTLCLYSVLSHLPVANGSRTRYLRALHNHGALGRQRSDYLRRLIWNISSSLWLIGAV